MWVSGVFVWVGMERKMECWGKKGMDSGENTSYQCHNLDSSIPTALVSRANGPGGRREGRFWLSYPAWESCISERK